MKRVKLVLALTTISSFALRHDKSIPIISNQHRNAIEMDMREQMQQMMMGQNRTVPCSSRLDDIKPIEKPHVEDAITIESILRNETDLDNIVRTRKECIDGIVGAATENSYLGYKCDKVHLYSLIDTVALGLGIMGDSVPNYLNDVWGWTDPKSGREFAIVGMISGTAFVEITDPLYPVHVGVLPAYVQGSSVWRDIKTYKHYAYIVSEQFDHGMQIFDLRLLLKAPENSVFTEVKHYSGFGSAHNLFINEENGRAYAVGSDRCNWGLYIMQLIAEDDSSDDDAYEDDHDDMFFIDDDDDESFTIGSTSDSKNNTKMKNAQSLFDNDYVQFVACFEDDGYVHDVQCVIYNGPDEHYIDREICFSFNEDSIVIVDVTDGNEIDMLSQETYENHRYTHQGWLTENQEFLIFADENDEKDFSERTKTMVFDVRNLESPQYVGPHFGTTRATDHNQYVLRDHTFQANYQAGFQLLHIDDIETAQFTQVAFFDVYNNGDDAEFNGAFSVYPFFESGTIVVTGIEQGLFLLDVSDVIPNPYHGSGTASFDPQGEDGSETSSESIASTIVPSTSQTRGDILTASPTHSPTKAPIIKHGKPKKKRRPKKQMAKRSRII